MILAGGALIGWVANCLFPCDTVFLRRGSRCLVAGVRSQQPLIWEQRLSGLHL